MDASILSPSLLLTFLSLIGLVFFIRASIKDRTQQIKIVTSDSEEIVLSKLKAYFDARAYKVTSFDPEKNQITLEGFVQPSWFLAIFLTGLAALGLFCLALMLSFFYPFLGNNVWIVLLFAPTAGVFYFRNAGRVEQVLFQIETILETEQEAKNQLTVTAHRDELIQLQKTVSFN